MSHALYIVDTDPALSLVKQHIADRQRVRLQNHALATELGITQWHVSRTTGEITAVDFPEEVHPQFKKPGRFGSQPKKNSEWAKRFSEQKGYECASGAIAQAFKVPTSISYVTLDGGKGWRMMGFPFQECGFLFLSEDGPYAIWIPDVAACVSQLEDKGYTVDEEAKSFNMQIPGCRRIEQEEWDILVAQKKLNDKRAAEQTREKKR